MEDKIIILRRRLIEQKIIEFGEFDTYKRQNLHQADSYKSPIDVYKCQNSRNELSIQ